MPFAIPKQNKSDKNLKIKEEIKMLTPQSNWNDFYLLKL